MIFINAFEYNYLGTRVLASYLRQLAIRHIIYYCAEELSGDTIVKNLQENHLGYMIFIAGKLISHTDNIWPILEEDFLALRKIIKEESPDVIGFSARSTNNYLIPDIISVFRHSAPNAF